MGIIFCHFVCYHYFLHCEAAENMDTNFLTISQPCLVIKFDYKIDNKRLSSSLFLS